MLVVRILAIQCLIISFLSAAPVSAQNQTHSFENRIKSCAAYLIEKEYTFPQNIIFGSISDDKQELKLECDVIIPEKAQWRTTLGEINKWARSTHSEYCKKKQILHESHCNNVSAIEQTTAEALYLNSWDAVLGSNDILPYDDAVSFSVAISEVDFPKLSSCNQPCLVNLEYVIGAGHWKALYIEVFKEGLKKSHKQAKSARENYSTYFFERGEGMYLWEIWANSRLKKPDGPLSPPDGRIHLLHPTLLFQYDDQDGEVSPTFAMELIGYSYVSYDKNQQWKNIGASLAFDLKDDEIRYGGVFHLPIKATVKSILGESAAEIVPCEICSIAVLSNGDDEISVGFKVNTAQLFFTKDEIRKKYQTFVE